MRIPSLLVLLLSVSILEASTSSPNQITEAANAKAETSYSDIGECIGAVYQREFEKISRLFPKHSTLDSDLRQALGSFISSVKIPFTGQTDMEEKLYKLYVSKHFVSLQRRLDDLKTKWSNAEELMEPLCAFLDIEDNFLDLVSNTMADAYHEYSRSRKEATSSPPVEVPLSGQKDCSSGLVTFEVPGPNAQLYPIFTTANVGSLSAAAQESTSSLKKAAKNSTFEVEQSNQHLSGCIDAVFKREFREICNLFPRYPIASSELYCLFEEFIQAVQFSSAYQAVIDESAFELFVGNHFCELKRRLSDLKAEWYLQGKDFTTALYHLCDVEDTILNLVSTKLFHAYNEFKSVHKKSLSATKDVPSSLITLESSGPKSEKQDNAHSTLNFDSLLSHFGAATKQPHVPVYDNVPLKTPAAPAKNAAAVAPAPLSLKKPNELMWPVEEFRQELRHVLETEWQFAFETLADLPQCSYLLENIHAFPHKLTGAGLDYNGTFDEIMTSLNLLLQQYVRDDAYLAVSTRMDFDPDMYTDIVNMVYPEVAQQYYMICSSTLLKYYVATQATGKTSPLMDVDFSDYEMVQMPAEVPLNDYIPLSGHENYLRLAARIGIDHNNPMSLLEEKYAARLRKYGYDVSSPEFQDFLNNARMSMAAPEPENDENLPPAIPSDGRLKSSQPKLSSSVQRRLDRNLAIIAQLRMLLDAPEFLNEFKMALVGETGNEDTAELYADQISQMLSDLVTADWSSFQPTPSSPKPRYMHLIIKEAVDLKCDEISGTLCFDDLAVRVSAAAYNFIGARIFPSDEKASAVSGWHASYDELDSAPSSARAGSYSPIHQFTSSAISGSGKVTFSDEQTVKDFDHRSPPMAVSDETIDEPVTSAPAYRLIAYNEENVPEFPFDAPSDVMIRPAYLTETADYLRQHGQTSELRLDQRLEAADVALSTVIDESLSTATIEVRDSVHQLYFEMLMDAFKPIRK